MEGAKWKFDFPERMHEYERFGKVLVRIYEHLSPHTERANEVMRSTDTRKYSKIASTLFHAFNNKYIFRVILVDE